MLSDVAATGNRIATLEALRNRLATELDGCASSRDVAALASRLQAVMAELDTIAPPVAGLTPLDELRLRRADLTMKRSTGL